VCSSDLFWQKQGFKIYMHRLYREIA
jgi:hypothetical protein